MLYEKKIIFFLIISIIIMPIAMAQTDFLIPTYITIIIGIFSFVAFFIISYIHSKNELAVGPWVLISFAILFLTVGEYFRVFVQKTLIYQLCLIAGMVMLFFTALFKYWDTMRLTQ